MSVYTYVYIYIYIQRRERERENIENIENTVYNYTFISLIHMYIYIYIPIFTPNLIILPGGYLDLVSETLAGCGVLCTSFRSTQGVDSGRQRIDTGGGF